MAACGVVDGRKVIYTGFPEISFHTHPCLTKVIDFFAEDIVVERQSIQSFSGSHTHLCKMHCRYPVYGQ